MAKPRFYEPRTITLNFRVTHKALNNRCDLYVGEGVAPANWPALATFNARLTAILSRPAPVDDDGALAPAMLKLSPEAKAAWVAFHDQIEVMLSPA